jgi:transposase InsO family protein
VNELRIALVAWIEPTYHHRPQEALGQLTPIDYETTITPSRAGCLETQAVT